ncbi:unnamed protein product [Soboliphyme baturini]|uniref:Uncharacterized protein n=1 Tax=Soboliphyme baturini TaxID=241478 RepID=A0A183J540_9BILA|nr:unnamed protein product [Soboliphyme baturini]
MGDEANHLEENCRFPAAAHRRSKASQGQFMAPLGGVIVPNISVDTPVYHFCPTDEANGVSGFKESAPSQTRRNTIHIDHSE